MFGLINIFGANMVHELKNFTNYIYYGVTGNNKLFSIEPDQCENESIKNFIYINIYSRSQSTEQFGGYTVATYVPPSPNLPLYIAELNCVIFVSEEERSDNIRIYGSGNKLVEARASRLVPLINGSYKVTVSLSSRPYFTVVNKEIHEIPIATDSYIQEAIVNHSITKETLEHADVFIVETILRNALTNKANVSAHELKVVRRDRINDKDPIIFANSGLILFSNRKACETFIEKYDGSLEDYLINKAYTKVERDHNREIDEIISQTKQDKRSIVEIFTIMGGTGLASIIIENIIKAIIEKNKEKSNKPNVEKLISYTTSESNIGAAAIVTGLVLIGASVHKVLESFKEDEKLLEMIKLIQYKKNRNKMIL